MDAVVPGCSQMIKTMTMTRKLLRGLLTAGLLSYLTNSAMAAGKFNATNAAGLSALLSSNSECLIRTQGSFLMDIPMIIESKKGIILDGGGGTWTLGPNYSFAIRNSSRIEIRNVNIVDPQNRSVGLDAFEFDHSDNSGLQNIKYENSS